MMQHAGRLDDVERPSDPAEPQDVGLRIVDGKPELARLADRHRRDWRR